MLDDTLIVFTSDHGDMLGDHFMIQKGVPWKQSVGIPLAVRLPGARLLVKTPHRLKFPTLQQLHSLCRIGYTAGAQQKLAGV